MLETPQAKKEAYEQAYEEAHSLPSLINPSDVTGFDGDSWGEMDNDLIRREIGESLSVIRSERQYDGLQRDLAITLWRDSLPRVPLSDMSFETQEECVENGYWPHRMNKWEIEELLFEQDIPNQCMNEAWEIISRGIADKMNPNRDKGY